MLVFEVQDMQCGHCMRAVTDAVHAVLPQAGVQVDLAQRRVQVDTGAVAGEGVTEALQQALAAAGYRADAVAA